MGGHPEGSALYNRAQLSHPPKTREEQIYVADCHL